MKRFLRFLPSLVMVLVAVGVAVEAKSTRSKVTENQKKQRLMSAKEYSYAYWKNGWRKHKGDSSPNILCFESGYYGFMLDMAKLNQPKFGVFKDDSNVVSTLSSGLARMDKLSKADLDISLEIDGKNYRLVSCKAAPGKDANPLVEARMMEAGQVAQHFDIQKLVFKDDAGNKLGCYANLDIVAWPGSLTFNLNIMPDLLYENGPSEGIVGTGLCVIDKPVDIPHRDEIDPEVFTMEMWMKIPKSIKTKGNWLLCKSLHNWQDGNIAFRFWGRHATATMNIGGGPKNKHSLNLGHLKRNEWNHLAMSYDGNEMRAYLNGRPTAQKIIGKKRKPGKGNLRIGQREDGNFPPLEGLYDQIRIWNRVLSPNELKAHSAHPDKIPSRKGLVLEENFEKIGTVKKPDWNNAKVKMSLKTAQNHWQKEQVVKGKWNILDDKTFTLNCNITQQDTEKISIKVRTPANQSFPVVFDTELNCLTATIKGLKRDKDFGSNGGRKYDEFIIDVENNGKKEQMVPFLLNFRDGYGITGNVPILCDEHGVLTGIHVQLSKNWHYGAYKLPYAILPAKPGKTRYLLRYVYGFYGKLPSASHSQLSLYGYGGNGRWDQLAIGCWGETICFDTDMSLTNYAVTDIRGLMLRNGLKSGKWGWTDAGHGADWLFASDDKGKKLLFNDLKVAYLAHGPCLTDVWYDGYYGAGREVDFKVNIMTLRTNDYARTFQNLEYKFLKPVSAGKSRFYHLSRKSITNKAVYGNKDGVIAELTMPANAKDGHLLADHVTLKGEGPWWISFPGAKTGHEQPTGKGGGTGSRALIIRSYSAHLNGKQFTNPTINLAVKDSHGKKGIEFNLIPPKEISSLKPGDDVKVDMELITLPRIIDDYYGDNQAFIEHLKSNPRSWKTVYREAKGNDLQIKAVGGSVLKKYPVIIKATAPEVSVYIKGGVGYVPIRFEALKSKDYALYEVVNGNEIMLDQSVHGNDFWQTDYDASTGTYKMTYNLPLDGKTSSKWLLKKRVLQQPAKLKILKALYGVKDTPAKQVDVKKKLQQIVDTDINMIVVSNALAGKDPARGIRKSLELEYVLKGKRIKRTLHEGQKLDFGTGTGPVKAEYLNVPYDKYERTKLNFWQAKGKGPRPLLVIIHGGGWLGRNKGEKAPINYLAKGISVAAINYRYSSIAPLPAPVHDAVRAIQFLRHKAKEWNIDKNRIVLTGDSAGGCTSVWIACRDDLANPKSKDPVERESSRIQGAAVAGAQVSVDPKQIKEWVGEQYAVHGMISMAVGETSPEATWNNYAKHKATFKEFSAINHLSKDDPPIFLAYNADLTVPAKSYGHAIHHGLFGVKFKEKSDKLGHNKVFLWIGKKYTSPYSNLSDFITKVLLEPGSVKPVAVTKNKASARHKSLDLNRNGSVSKEEFLTVFFEHFDNLDRSKDKFLTPNEYGNKNAFKAMDKDKNGKIAKDEFLGFHRGNFKTLDRDKDGILSTDEL